MPKTFRGLQARINPLVDLDTITIKLRQVGDAEVTLSGRVKTGRRQVDTSTRVHVVTLSLTDTGATFIREMKEMFTPIMPGKPPGGTT